MNKKVVLIAPSPYEPNPDIHTGNRLALPAMPLAIVTVGSVLARHGINVELIDVQMDFGLALTEAADREICARIVSHLYHERKDILWIGMSCLSRSHTINGLRLGKQIKSALPDIPLIFGGYFPSGQYSHLLTTFPFIDGIVYGDGEIASLEITLRLARGYSLLTDEIPNWVFRPTSGTPIRSNQVSHVDVDSLPGPDYTLLRNYKKYPIGSIVTSRGCPFRCGYCVEPAMRSYRPIHLAKLANEFFVLNTILPCRDMFVYDPLFGLGQKRTRELTRIFGMTKFR